MALKIVHLCDVHSSKGEDVPAQYAHTMTLDGGTYAIDLCPSCDNERFMPLAAFLEGFGLLTDGVVDPREAVAENLRMTVAQLTKATSPRPVKSKPAPAPALIVASEPEEPPREPETLPERTELLGDPNTTRTTLERRRATLDMLRDAPEGLSAQDITERLGVDIGASGLANGVLTPLRERGLVDFIGQRWWVPENVPTKMREESERMRALVATRNATPRVCIVDGESFLSTSAWEDHCRDVHGVKPVEFLGLTCPFDGEEFSAPQVLGMHARKVHDCTHTPLLFQRADEAGDPLGLIADIRSRFAVK